ncbi:hypothetical protein EC844_101327 [Acinetobacter calcoaceticus]|uniref:Cardiolipin synthase N-terminal domain-containing protein n=1 Tax=Acinetobacter calcoaceticus TaxID=471 RepID=A0A4R1Y394_ACICA|nr:hypothetical protein EC844_101327 [Acinetobacter calcoaceticus]
MDGLGWYFQYFSIFGVGVHVLIAVFFAIHAIRHGRPFFWLWILFVFPFLGSVVYFIAEYLPQSRMPDQANALGRRMRHVLQPHRELNKAKEDYQNIPSVDNAVLYADYLTAAGKATEAIAVLEQKLHGIYQHDPAILEQLAMAFLQDQQAEKVLATTALIKRTTADYKVEDIALLRALSQHELGHQDLAQQEFLIAIRSKNVANLAEYALWAIQTQQTELSHDIYAEMQKSWAMWTQYARKMHKPIFKQVEKALKRMDKIASKT